jgi:hypothetical protein
LIARAPETNLSFKFAVVGMIAFMAVALVAPLAAFTPGLIALKRGGLRRYSTLVTTHNMAFESKWIDNVDRSPRRAAARLARRLVAGGPRHGVRDGQEHASDARPGRRSPRWCWRC